MGWLRGGGCFWQPEHFAFGWCETFERFEHMRRMNLLTLSIKLPSLFTLADSLASLLFGGNDLFLDLCPNIGAGGSGSLRLCCICPTHAFRFPLADPLSLYRSPQSSSPITPSPTPTTY